jgi:hypothetical protein
MRACPNEDENLEFLNGTAEKRRLGFWPVFAIFGGLIVPAVLIMIFYPVPAVLSIKPIPAFSQVEADFLSRFRYLQTLLLIPSIIENARLLFRRNRP